MLNRLSYENIFGMTRIAIGVVLAAVLCLPALDRCTSRNRGWLWLSAALWFVPWPSLITFTDQPPGMSELFFDLSGVLILLWILTVRQLAHAARRAV